MGRSALVAGFTAGWLLASRSRAEHQTNCATPSTLAATTLKASTDEFLKLADQKIGNAPRRGDGFTRRQMELGSLVTPIKDTLVQHDAALREVEKTRIDDSASMKSLLNLVGHTQKQLQQETQNLVRVAIAGVRGNGGSPAEKSRGAGRHDGALRFRSAADHLHRSRPPQT